jgi:hypothetical protein
VFLLLREHRVVLQFGQGLTLFHFKNYARRRCASKHSKCFIEQSIPIMASCNNVNHPHQSVILSLLPYSFEALPFQPVLALLICFNPAPILTQHLPKTPLNKHLFPLLHLVLQHLTPLDHTPPPFHDSRQPSHSQ